jgi:hypothetical protein
VKTPRTAVTLKTILPGKYYHFVIAKGIWDALLIMHIEQLFVNPVPLCVAKDGVSSTAC